MMQEFLEKNQRNDLFQFDWLLRIWFSPVEVFKSAVAQTSRVWLTPMVVMSIAAFAYAIANGSVNQPGFDAAMDPGLEENYEQFQIEGGFSEEFAPFQEEADPGESVRPNPASPFTGFLNGLFSVAQVLASWLIIAGALYLSFTLSGGRIDGLVARNLVAWAGLPLALRSVLRTAAVLLTIQPIRNPGLAGFAPIDASGANILAVAFLSLVDVYLLWSIILLIIGGREASGWVISKAARAIGIPISILIIMQAGISYGTVVISQQINTAFSSGF